MCRCVSGRERLREINSASTDKTPLTHPLELPSGNATVCLTHTEVRVGLPPVMPKPNTDMIAAYSEHSDSLVLVSGVAIGGAPVTATQDKKKRGRPPKKPDESSRHSYKKRATRLCAQCVSSNRSEVSKTCKGSGGDRFCQYLNSQDLGTAHGVPQNTSGFLERYRVYSFDHDRLNSL